MVLYQDEKKYIETFKARVSGNEEISKEQLEELVGKYEDMMEMSSVTFRMIDRLMHNYDKLKQEVATS